MTCEYWFFRSTKINGKLNLSCLTKLVLHVLLDEFLKLYRHIESYITCTDRLSGLLGEGRSGEMRLNVVIRIITFI